MSKIKYTITIEAETEAPLDDFSVKAIGKAIIEGAEQNVDSETTLDVTEMNATFQTSLDCIGTPVAEEENVPEENETFPAHM